MTKAELAYIAGFLDGDGSLMLQLKPRKSVFFGFRVRTIICFYQDKRYQKGIHWIKEKLGVGYISKRNDDMIELRLEGHKRVKKILTKLKPFIVFKTEQLKLILEAIKIMETKLTPITFLEVCKISDKISSINYATTRKIYNYAFVKSVFVKKGLISP
jgi:hypothetical protein